MPAFLLILIKCIIRNNQQELTLIKLITEVHEIKKLLLTS